MARKKVDKKSQEKSIFEREIDLPWYVWGLGILIVVGLVLWLGFSGIGKSNYKGIVFEAEKYGTAIVYHYSYFYKQPDGQAIKYNLYLHSNPAKNDVPIDAQIVYPEYGDEVKLSIDSGKLLNCSESARAVGILSEFLVSNGFKIKVGTTNVNLSMGNNITYMTCETHPNDFMISLSTGNETRVVQQGNCFKIEANNCEIEKAMEKFVLESIVQARQRTKQN